jgi:3-oxoacyl-[acyl-carrier-protein] synthase III
MQLIHSLVCVLGDKKVFVRDEIGDAEFASSFCAYTGIETSYLCDRESLLDLACIAVSEVTARHNALTRIIVVTQTFEPRCPGLGFMISDKLNLSYPIIEINSACQGFVEAMSLASSLGGISLIVCADKLGSHVRTVSQDRSVRFLFSDCASACLVSGVGTFKQMIKPDLAEALCISSSSAVMNGEAISFAASRFVPELLGSFLRPSDGLVLHQANLAIIRRIERRLKRSSLVSIDKFANTSSSSIPLGIAHAYLSGATMAPSLALCGYGAGFAVSACRVELALQGVVKIVL